MSRSQSGAGVPCLEQCHAHRCMGHHAPLLVNEDVWGHRSSGNPATSIRTSRWQAIDVLASMRGASVDWRQRDLTRR